MNKHSFNQDSFHCLMYVRPCVSVRPNQCSWEFGPGRTVEIHDKVLWFWVQDVADVLAALDKALSLGYADSSRVAVYGGSHGGFLAAHLIGQVTKKKNAHRLRIAHSV